MLSPPVTHAGGEILPRAWSAQGIHIGCASNPASTHRGGTRKRSLTSGSEHAECDGHDSQRITRSLNRWFTEVLLSSLKLHGLHYWRAPTEGATSACLGLMSWEVTGVCALLLLLQPGEAVSCCLSLCLWTVQKYKNWGEQTQEVWRSRAGRARHSCALYLQSSAHSLELARAIF